ncbi:hypothetical protein [Prevotella sp.]|uniref:hypothetical protein n=1 Tax=Prevotella sp. TaxID=59823 RepID=UPI001CADC47A|nr:hypothetical protein [Prevotella sp.]MBF1596426.1 hypothetical protein [Prevotella sp.]
MKALFSKAKLGKLRYFLSLLLIMGCYVIYQRFLVVSYYDIGLFIVVTVVAVLYDKLIASKGFDAIVNNACICWVVVGLTLVLRSYYLPEKIYKVPLNGFSTLRVDHIYFSFKGKAFKRPFSLTDYDLSDICNRYDVELYLKEPLPTVYYISGMSLCKKENTTK